MKPIVLGPNVIRRFYRGGARIASFRGIATEHAPGPEDWVGSTTAARGEADSGRTRLDDGRLLQDVVGDIDVLVKLLDAGERLPVHLHPDDDFARAQLAEPCGKTEAWVILEAEPGASVHVGFAREVEPDELERWVDTEDVHAMLEAMVRVPVAAGDAIFVPAGVAHAIGEGIFLLELQQPSDLSILLEWRGIVPEADAYLGLSRASALEAVDRSAVSTDALTSSRGDTLFPPESDRFFRADRVRGGAVLEATPAILVVTDGEGTLRTEDARIPLRRGTTVLAGEGELTGTVTAIRCRPPLGGTPRPR